jgi:hypothetical protein
MIGKGNSRISAFASPVRLTPCLFLRHKLPDSAGGQQFNFPGMILGLDS